MSASNSASDRKVAPVEAVPAAEEQILNALMRKAYELGHLFNCILRVNASEIRPDTEGEDDDISAISELGKEQANRLADALDSLKTGLGGSARHVAQAAELAGVAIRAAEKDPEL